MFQLLIATRNQNKVNEIAALLAADLSGWRLYSLDDLDIAESVEETGKTFIENARIKALFFSRFTSLPTLGEDSGLVVPALGGRPGIFSARYAGKNAGDERRIDKLLREMESVTDRSARFVCSAVLAREGAVIATFTARVRGEILAGKAGNHGFGYDPVFFYPPLHKTFAELTLEEKNRVSHRAAVFRKLQKFMLSGKGS